MGASISSGRGRGILDITGGHPACAALLGVVAGLTVGGCGGMRNTKDASIATPSTPATVPDGGEFTIAESMNDTWNTVGQVLVRLDGVVYESRAQMLGIYAVRFRGERMLIRTQAVVMRDAGDGLLTRVVALKLDGKPNTSRAAIELLHLLGQRVPLEIGKYRQPIRLRKERTPG